MPVGIRLPVGAVDVSRLLAGLDVAHREPASAFFGLGPEEDAVELQQLAGLGIGEARHRVDHSHAEIIGQLDQLAHRRRPFI